MEHNNLAVYYHWMIQEEKKSSKAQTLLFWRWVIGLAYCVCILVSVFVCIFFFGTDQWPLSVQQLSCNYSAVCDIWVFKRSNTVSVLSQHTDLRRVSRRYKRSLAVFWWHTIVSPAFFLYTFPFFSLIFMYMEWASEMSFWHSEVIIEQRTAGRIVQEGKASMERKKEKRKSKFSGCILRWLYLKAQHGDKGFPCLNTPMDTSLPGIWRMHWLYLKIFLGKKWQMGQESDHRACPKLGPFKAMKMAKARSGQLFNGTV